MQEVARALSEWLAKNNIPANRVKISVALQDDAACVRAMDCVRRDVDPLIIRSSEGVMCNQIYGISFDFVPQKKLNG